MPSNANSLRHSASISDLSWVPVVVVPIVVPLTETVALATGFPLSSVTRPLRERFYAISPDTKNRTAKVNENNFFICMTDLKQER